MWAWEQASHKLRVRDGTIQSYVVGSGAIHSYFVGLVCMYCICNVVWGILVELTKIWLIVVDFNVFGYFR